MKDMRSVVFCHPKGDEATGTALLGRLKRLCRFDSCLPQHFCGGVAKW